MRKSLPKPAAIKLPPTLSQLLRRCSLIEDRSIENILEAHLLPYLKKYAHESMEEWQEAQEREEMETVIRDFEQENGFDPNHIPFDTQVLGLRRKLDNLEKEREADADARADLEKLRFSLLEELNFAEREALERQRKAQARKSEAWKKACKDYPLK